MKVFRHMILGLLAVLLLTGFIYIEVSPEFGGKPEMESINKIKKSPNYKNGKFQNLKETNVMVGGFFKAFKTFLFDKSKEDVPEQVLPAEKFSFSSINKADTNISVTWFGHSTVIIHTPEITIITDPMFNKRIQPLNMGPKAFNTNNPISIDSIPKIDVVLISHDHYDHLDYYSIKNINASFYYVPLGVKAHLIKWGVKAEKIIELDWYEDIAFSNNIHFISTPARHFSGRGLFNRNETLWCGWVMQINSKKVFFSGDSGYSDEFKKIGNRFGPFDLVLIENGQYNENWANIHMMPEESVQASIDLKGNAVLPIHWGKFSLSIHSWYEPIERFSSEALRKNVNIATPLMGQTFSLNNKLPNEKWWKNLKKQ